MVKLWEKYDEGTMSLAVRHIKQSVRSVVARAIYALTSISSLLPDFVFEKGEREAVAARSTAGKKRNRSSKASEYIDVLFESC